MISVNRVTKVVKGGRIMAFAALTVVGDSDGYVGMGKGKSKEVPVGVRNVEQTRRQMIKSQPQVGHGAPRRYRQTRRDDGADPARVGRYRRDRRWRDARCV